MRGASCRSSLLEKFWGRTQHVHAAPARCLARVRRMQNRYPLNGRGAAAIFGIATRAIVENGCGRQAWQMFASHATERKMNASPVAKPHRTRRKGAASPG